MCRGFVPHCAYGGTGRSASPSSIFPCVAGPASALPETARSIMAADVRLDEPCDAPQAGLGRDASKSEDALLLATLELYRTVRSRPVLGDFAFASWNKSTPSASSCGRDAFGIRPLAYVHKPGKLFAFASFPKALHGAGIVPKKIDEDALARRMVRNLRTTIA